jgi:hypothetical protein
MLMKMHIMPRHLLHAATATTPVSRQHRDYLCLRTCADLGKGLLDLETGLCLMLAVTSLSRIVCQVCNQWHVHNRKVGANVPASSSS